MATDPHWPTALDWLEGDEPKPDLVLIGVPTSAGSISPSDAWETPEAVRRVLDRFSSYDVEANVDLSVLAAADRGDWLVSHLGVEQAVDHLAKATGGLPTTPVHLLVGGDNLITYPIAANLPHAPLERTGVVTFDAHHDVRELEGTRLSNGSPIRLLIEDGLPGEQVVQIGIHSFANSRYYRGWCEDHDIRVADMPMIDEHGLDFVVTEALSYLDGLVDVIHVDFDIDVLDRAYAPACPGARPGGLTPRQLASAARRCGAHPKVMTADFVEVDATRDVADTTVMSLVNTMLAFASGVATRSGERE
ncbi:MAG: agmatinase family protein [Nitriliruptorales bacterium]|nr:agmatinase family protein [Nitriliruptorales bacterium]